MRGNKLPPERGGPAGYLPCTYLSVLGITIAPVVLPSLVSPQGVRLFIARLVSSRRVRVSLCVCVSSCLCVCLPLWCLRSRTVSLVSVGRLVTRVLFVVLLVALLVVLTITALALWSPACTRSRLTACSRSARQAGFLSGTWVSSSASRNTTCTKTRTA